MGTRISKRRQPAPARLFISYAHSDHDLKEELLKHFALLRHEHLISDWHDRMILPSQDWAAIIDERLKSADVILLLITANFMASEYCWGIEMKAALRQHRNGLARVVPVVLKDVDWQSAPFGRFQALPTDGKAVMSRHWSNPDEAFTDVATGLRRLLLTRPKKISRRRTLSRDADQFAEDVSAAYRLLGYHVARDASLERAGIVGYRCELTVRGGGTVALIVVPCFTGSAKLAAMSLKAAIQDGEDNILRGVVVTNQALTRTLAAPDRIQFTTYAELLDEVLSVSSSLRQYCTDYEHQDIFYSYLPLRCVEADAGDSVPTPVADLLGRWLADKTAALLTLLGDFGTGKTTQLQRLKYELASRYLRNESRIIPVYIALREFESYGSLQAFVESQISRELDAPLTYDRFRQLLGQGRILLLLDGFDEMGQQVDATKRRTLFQALLPLMLASRKTVLTCRPAYFLTHAEIAQVLSLYGAFSISPREVRRSVSRQHGRFLSAVDAWNEVDRRERSDVASMSIRIATLTDLSEDDIGRYVMTHARANQLDAEALLTRIRTTYDLRDLARRPVLLNLIVNSLPRLPDAIEASPSVIYDAYTDSWMNHDYAKGPVRRLLTSKQKREFMQALAWTLFTKGIHEIRYQDLQPHLSTFFREEGRMLDFIATDIQACSFLIRDQEGVFRFSHKSFMEYFVAEYLREQCVAERWNVLSTGPLSEEVIFFLGDMVHADDAFRQSFLKHTAALCSDSHSWNQALENAFRVFGASRSSLRVVAHRLNLRGVRFTKCGLSGEWATGEWEKSSFTQSEWRNLTLTDIVFSDVTLKNCQLYQVKCLDILSKPQLAVLTVEIGAISECEFGGRLFLQVKDTDLQQVSLMAAEGRVDVRGGKIGRSIGMQRRVEWKLTNVVAHQSWFTCSDPHMLAEPLLNSIANDKKLGVVSEWSGTDFEGCVFHYWDFSRTSINACRFVNCLFVCCLFKNVSAVIDLDQVCDPTCRHVGTMISSPEGADLRRLRARAPRISSQFLDQALKIVERNELQRSLLGETAFRIEKSGLKALVDGRKTLDLLAYSVSSATLGAAAPCVLRSVGRMSG